MMVWRVKNVYYVIGEESHPKLAMAAARAELENFFDSLPLLQPWAWKLITAVAAVAGFAVGVSLALWAGFTLSV